MHRFLSALTLSVGALAIGACADSSNPITTPAAPTSAMINEPAEFTHLGIVPTRQVADGMRNTELAPARGAPTNMAGSGGIIYHGGPMLMTGTNVVAIYWAKIKIYKNGPTPGTNGSGTRDTSTIGFFLKHIGGSPYFNINSTYVDSNNVPITNKVTYTHFWAKSSGYIPVIGDTVTDRAIHNMLDGGFKAGKITYDYHTLYLVFTGANINLGGGFGAVPQYCAYHSHTFITIAGVKRRVLYAVMPMDQSKPTYCSALSGSPNSDLAADAEVNTLVHETEETTTDEMGNAYYDLSGFENADKCAWTFGTTFAATNGATANVTLDGKSFLIQQNWVNTGATGSPGANCKMSH